MRKEGMNGLATGNLDNKPLQETDIVILPVPYRK